MGELITYYRITSIPSTNPSPIYQEDKDKLNELCLKSFVNAFKKVSPKMVFICDYCGDETMEMIYTVCKFDKEVIRTTLGQNGTSLKQYEMAREQDRDIYFAESDYLYLENSGVDLLNGLREFELVSPYDHPFHYKTDYPSKIRLVDNHHWRSAENNTMTWAITNKLFKDHYDIFYKYGYLDHFVWDDLRAEGHELWVPAPSLATHMVSNALAPVISWSEIYER
jgi:hypothetical protein